MKLNEMIKENENNRITSELLKNGYKDFYNKYAPFSIFSTKDIENIITEFIDKYVSEYFNDKYNQFTLSDKSEVLIQSNAPCLGSGRLIDNFEYTKEKYLLER